MKNFFNEFKKYFYTTHFHGGRRHSDGDLKYYLRRRRACGEAGIWLLPACPRSISEPSAVPSVLPNSTNKTFRLLAGGRR